MKTGPAGWWAFALLGIGVVAVTQAKKPTVPATAPRIEAGLDKLVPSFRAKVEVLLEQMRATGHRPRVFETYRTAERAAELAKKGTGVALSQHTLGTAVDIVDADDTPWDAPAKFWTDLHRFALDLGLGRIQRKQPNGALAWDQPHVQALPGRYDTKLRTLADAAARDAFVRNLYTA